VRGQHDRAAGVGRLRLPRPPGSYSAGGLCVFAHGLCACAGGLCAFVCGPVLADVSGHWPPAR
jgi:hypothetical protein